MNTSLTNPLAPAAAGSQIAADQLAAQRAKRELRRLNGNDEDDVRAIEDPVAITEINNHSHDEQPKDQKRKKPKDDKDRHQLDVTA